MDGRLELPLSLELSQGAGLAAIREFYGPSALEASSAPEAA